MRQRERPGHGRAGRRGLVAAIVCAGFVLTLPGVFGQVVAMVDGVLFETATAGPTPTNTTQTTSFTENTNFTRVDRSAEAFETRIVAERDGVVVHDQTDDLAPGSTPFDAALAALAGACAVSGPTLLSSSASAATVPLGDEQDRFEETATTTRTIGPATIFVGPNLSEQFVVEAGTQNIDSLFHTEFFVNQVFETTVTHHATYGFAGSSCAAALPEPTVEVAPADAGPSPPAVATPIPATPRTAG